MRLERIANVADARRAARRRLPRVIFDYVDGAADDETTMRENEAVFDDVVFRPHMGMGVSSPDLSTTVLGTEVALPILLAPCGLVRAMHPDAGVGVARAAASRGTLSVLSTVAGSPVEDVVAAAPGRVWFQLYSSGGRPDAEQVCARAAAAGVSVLVVTIDTPALGNRERDIHHGVAPPLRIGAHNALHLGPQVLSRPMWTYRMARDGLDVLGRAPGRAASGRGAASGRSGRSAGRSARSADGGGLLAAFDLRALSAALGRRSAATDGSTDVRDFGQGLVATPKMLSMAASPFTWDDIAWLRERWTGKLIVKGILGGDDARRAADSGADAVIVSNHGGRQLDGAPSTLSVLPEVVAALGGAGGSGGSGGSAGSRPEGPSIEVYLDGGIRRGAHVLKALSLGANAVLIGRPYLWGLAVGGQAGVGKIVDLMAVEMNRTMILLGCASVRELGPEWVEARPAGLSSRLSSH